MKPEEITEGIYFGLPEDVYHATPWLGSSNMKTLYSSPPDYWFESAMNPLREPDDPSSAQTFGTALHHRVLYGAEAFERDYTHIDGTMTESPSAEDLKEFITAQGGKPAKLKADNERMVREMGVRLLTQKTYEKVMVSAAQIVKNPHLAQAFTGGWPEVSVFWREGDVPCKARFDYLKLKAIVDLKSFSSKNRINTIDRWVIQDLFNYRYDIQVAHYLRGHAAAGALFDAGKVFALPGATRPTDDWLRQALGARAHWVFVFYKSDGMPISKSYQVPNESPCHMSGEAALKTALDAYRDNFEKFGTDAWVNMDPPFQIDEEDLPKWL